MHILIPPFILQNYAAGRSGGAFPAVGLFVDISGFTAMTDVLMEHGQHGAEVMAQVMRQAFAPLISAVYEQGGFVALHAGDSFTALFALEGGDSLAARRAVTAAWQIQQRVAAQPAYATPYGEFPVTVKAGLALGEAQWGVVTSKDQRRAACYFSGSAVDGCALAEHRTCPGEALVDDQCYAQLVGWAAAEPAGEYWRITALPQDLPAAQPLVLPDLDLSLAGRFLPGDLFTQSYSGEFRQLVFLFVSLRVRPDAAGLQRFMQHVFASQDRYGGHLKLLFGDKGPHLLLVWGAPLAYENDLDRALNFILELRAAAGIPIAGAATYRIAHAGFIGSELSEEYAGYGRGVNLAARFMTAAGDGEIWLDEFAARKAQANFETDFLEQRSFKGFSQPQDVYCLRRRKEATQIAYQGELVGRQAELEKLAAFIQPLQRGQFAGTLVVWGEAGMGKSRLVHEFLSGQKFNFLEEIEFLAPQLFLAQTNAILRTALNPFRYWLRRYFGVSDTESPARNRASFDIRLDDLRTRTSEPRLAAELQRTRSFLGALVGLSWPGSLYEQFDARQRYENTLIGLTTLLQAESLQRPVILLLEDVHWLDADSAAYLPRLLRALTADEARQYPLAILATARFEGAALPLDTFDFQRLDLSQLDRPALAGLAAALLGAHPAPELLDLLEARSGGNPFFAEQIVRYLEEEHLLLPDPKGLFLKPLGSGGVLPSDANALLVARLDRLAQTVRELVLTAAVLGREFEVRLLAHMLHDDERLPAGLAQGEREAIWAALSELRYIFRHAMLRDAAYHMQVLTRRQALHALAMEALESLHAALPAQESPTAQAQHYGELAYHAEQAGLLDKARRYLRQAGDAAAVSYQNIQALDDYTRALALTPEEESAARFELLAAREDVLETLGRQDERQRDLDALETLAQQSSEAVQQAAWQLEVLQRRSDFFHQTGNFSASCGAAQQIIERAQSPGERLAALLAYNRLALSELRLDQFEAASRHVQLGLDLARRHGFPYQETWLLTTQGMIANEQRSIPQALASFAAALASAQATGDRQSQAQALNNLGMVAGFQGDYPAARRYYQQSLEIAREMGVRLGEGIVLGNLGYILSMIGEYEQAYRYTQDQLRIAREIGSAYTEAYGLINLSAYAIALGNYAEAQRYAQSGLERIRQVGESSGEAWAFTYLGHSQFAVGQVAEAGASYQAALDIRRQLDQPLLATEPLAGLARCALASGDLPAAQTYLDEILAFLHSGAALDGVDDPLRVYLTGYLVLAQTADPRAAGMLETAYSLLQKRSAAIQDEVSRRIFQENIEVNRLILEAWRYFHHPGG